MLENSGDTDCCTYNINNMLNSKKGEIWQSLISKLAFSASCVYLPKSTFLGYHMLFVPVFMK